ncbi:hypothetical protein BJ742DRAFT_299133 [Cladochytrium replicatum]|nr:hypothetical protein BJ742DRAFT_299133 [Cladochytrium replicatum]
MHSIPFSLHPGRTPQAALQHPTPSSQPLPAGSTSPAVRPTPPLQLPTSRPPSFPPNSAFPMYVPSPYPTSDTSAEDFRWQQQNAQRYRNSVPYSPYLLSAQFPYPSQYQQQPPTSPTQSQQQSASSSSSSSSTYPPPSQSPQRMPQSHQIQPYQHHQEQQELLAKAANEALRQQPALHAQVSSGPSPQPPIALSGIYSSTGFDMLSILAKIACRPNPSITIGPVDFSCSFLVVDAKTPANPIVYASDTFEKLTGYSNAEIIGRNCRFLQSPDGLVEPFSLRKYTDNSVVKQIKQSLDGLQECQYTLINYKKGGVPFINLLTIIPISWDNPKEISLFVGFQVDLVDQPQAILNRMKDGQYVVNYQIAQNIQQHTIRDEDGQADELSELLSLHTSTSVQASKNVPEMLHTFVDTFADFLFILSLRGLFLYASSSSARRLMEYKQEELLGHKLAEFVHPADLVAVMRELRNSAPGGRINLVCRFRRKHSGYVYMEVTGHVYEGEAGKRTKCFVLSGRERSVGSLPLRDVLPPDIDPMRETWAKVTYEGLFLFACSNAAGVLGYTPSELFARALVEIVHEKDRSVVADTLRSIKGLVTQPFPSPPLSVVQPPASATPTTVTTDGGESSATSCAPQSEKRGVYRDVRVRIVAPRQPQSFTPVHIRVYSDGDRFTRYLFLQIKVIQPGANGSLQLGQVSTTTNSAADYAERMGMWNGSPAGTSGGGRDLLDVMSSTRATSLHYELNQLRMANKRLREELESLEHGGKRRMTIYEV